MSATNKNGGVVSVNDHVAITAKVVSYTGSGSLASVVVQAPLDVSTFNIKAYDAEAVEQISDASHTASSNSGKVYGVAGDDLTARGVVTAISGSGINAVLTVLLSNSQTSINTAAGNCNSAT